MMTVLRIGAAALAVLSFWLVSDGLGWLLLLLALAIVLLLLEHVAANRFEAGEH